MIKYIICDIDGTIADIHHRLHFIKGQQGECHERTDPDWDAFNRACVDDEPKQDIIDIVNGFASLGYKIILMTGRNEKYRPQTVLWLKEKNVRNNLLLMRRQNDFRSDVTIKKDMYDLLFDYNLLQSNTQIAFVLEDRDKMVEMWRSLGLTCLQVEKGSY